MHCVKLSSKYSEHQVIKLHGYTKYTCEHLWELYRRLDFSPLVKHADLHKELVLL